MRRSEGWEDGVAMPVTDDQATTGRDIDELPRLPGVPLAGSAPALRRDALTVLDRARRLGEVVRITVGPPRFGGTLVGFFSPPAVQEVLTCRDPRLGKSGQYWTEVARWLGHGLLTSDGPEWARQRRMVSPMFGHSQLSRWQTVLEQEAARMAEELRAAAPTTVDLSPPAVRLALRAVSRTVFGTEDVAAATALHDGIGRGSVQMLRRANSPLRLPFRFPTPRQVPARRGFARTYALADSLIAARREQPGDDLVSLLLGARDETGTPLHHHEVREQAVLFLVAGHETTAIGVATALHRLAARPDLQDAVADDLELSRRVFLEAVRIWPPVYWTGRTVRGAMVLGGCRLPAGITAMVSPWVTHRDPDLWSHPQRFDPDRFTPDQVKKRPKGTYFPFGLGPQNCIGDRFATMEATLALSAVCRRVRLSDPQGPVGRTLGLTMRPVGLSARITPR
jgi:cytochrome P450